LKNPEKNLNFRQENTTAVLTAEGQKVTLENLGYVVSALESLLLKARYPVLQKLAGKIKISLGELYVNGFGG
jgi:hypothetical protein